MKSSAHRRLRLLAVLALIALTTLALAAPWAEPVWRVIRPQLPSFVVILAGVSAVAQLVVGLADVRSKGGARRSAALPLSLAASALCMALAFLPGGPGVAPRLLPIVGAALFAIIGAVMRHRALARRSDART